MISVSSRSVLAAEETSSSRLVRDAIQSQTKFFEEMSDEKRAHNEHGPRHVTPAGRSVFYDLGFDEAEARVLEMRADLMAALCEHIEKRGWTQSEAAKKLGITQPRISALMKGAWRDFSADMLLVLAARLGLRPTLRLAA
jgi:predicted XRE-type DNA-binding protein